MKFILVGFKSFHSERKNQDFLFLYTQKNDPTVVGAVVEDFFFSGEFYPEAIALGKTLTPDSLGSEIEVLFNRNGYAVDFRIL